QPEKPYCVPPGCVFARSLGSVPARALDDPRTSGTLLAMAHLRIKICGITTEADACQAALLGADAIGLNFYAPSPRCVSLATASQILRALPPLVDAVGVFVNQALGEVLPILHQLGRLRTIQWYGNHQEL